MPHHFEKYLIAEVIIFLGQSNEPKEHASMIVLMGIALWQILLELLY